MDSTAEIAQWAERNGLTPETMRILKEEDFTSLNDLALLTSADIDANFTNTNRLSIAQCLRLKKAVERLRPETTQGQASNAGNIVTHDFNGRSSRELEAGEQVQQQQTRSSFRPNSFLPRPIRQPRTPSNVRAEDQRRQQGPVYQKTRTPSAQTRLTKQAQPERSLQSLPLPSAKLKTPAGHKSIIRFVLVGKTGAGKSTTGNTILGAKKFVTSIGLSSETSKCEIHREVVLEENVEVVDTPGLYDTSVKEEAIAQVIVQALACMYPGPHAFLFLLKLGARFTQEEAGTFKRLIAIFDESVTKYMIVVFTGGDLLDPGSTISGILDKAPPDFLSILEACENRYVVFNNRSSDKTQVGRLLNITRKLMQQNDNQCYKCPKYFSVDETMQKEIEKRMAIVEKQESESNRHCKHLQEQIKILEEKQRAMLEKQEQESEKQLTECETVKKEKTCKLQEKPHNKERDEELEKRINEDLKAMKEELKEAKEKIKWDEMNRLKDKVAEDEKGVVATLVDGISGGIKKFWNRLCSHVPSLPVW